MSFVLFAKSSQYHAPDIVSKEDGDQISRRQNNANYSYSITIGNLSLTAQSKPVESERNRKEENKEADNEGTEYLPTIGGVKLKITDSILALFTVLLFVATSWLFFATDDLAAGAEETARRQLRAYVGIQSGGIANLTTPGPAFLDFKNFGATPAYNWRVKSELRIGAILPSTFDGTEPDSFIGPGGNVNNATELDGGVPEGWQFTSAQEGPTALFLYGIGKYVDAFGDDREIRFRYIVSRNPGAPGALGLLNLSAEGNSST